MQTKAAAYWRQGLAVAAIALAILVAATLSTPSPAMPASQSATSNWGRQDAADMLEISTTNCEGTCPVYHLRIFADRQYLYDGLDHVARNGAYRGRLDATTFRRLQDTIRSLRFDTRPDGSIGECKQFGLDSPSVHFTLFVHRRRLDIEHYLGCGGFPQERELLDFEHRIDAVLGLNIWLSD
jgi:hypothetical protein